MRADWWLMKKIDAVTNIVYISDIVGYYWGAGRSWWQLKTSKDEVWF